MSIVLHNHTNVQPYNKHKIINNLINKYVKKHHSISNSSCDYGKCDKKKKKQLTISQLNIFSVDTKLINSNILAFFQFLSMRSKFT